MKKQENTESMQRLDPTDPATLMVLKARTRALAAPSDTGSPVQGASRILVFELGGQRFAFPTNQVDRVLLSPKIFPLPGTPAHILGVANILGEILPILDLRPLLGMEAALADANARLLLLEHGAVKLGLMADSVEGILEFPESSFHPTPPTLQRSLSRYATLVLLDGTVLLDRNALLGDQSLAAGRE
ncbi:MAG: purine-binding chemotaxis protein CheW [Spirochaetes bacterium]|nr:MAG: purine-binding chemotaxis protein CheW [Spirochaetota bacterium]